MKFNNLGIFQSLELRISTGKIILISSKLNSTPNTLGCHGLINIEGEVHEGKLLLMSGVIRRRCSK